MLRTTLIRLMFKALFVLTDLLFITCIYFGLYLYRVAHEFHLTVGWSQITDIDFWVNMTYFEGYVKFYIIVTVAAFFFLRRYGLYSLENNVTLPDQFWRVTKAVLYSVITIAALSYMFKVQLFSRFVFITFSVTTVFGLWFWRVMKHWAVSKLLQRGYFNRRLIIVGAGEKGRLVAQELMARPGLGYTVVGFADDDPQKQNQNICGVPVVCPNNRLAETVAARQIDEILITIPSYRELTQNIITQCRRQDVQIRIVPEMFNLMTSSVEVGQLGPVPYMRIVKTPMQGMPLVFKRLFDVIVSLTGIVVLSPLMLATALAIKLDSPGPVLFRQKRVGKNGQLFDFYKFRSMVPNAEELLAELAAANEADGPVFKIKEDPRITRVGKFIRKYSIDELPQLFNVLKGDMSLVGPRPPLPNEVDQYGDFEWRRLEVIPGITGLWQVSGRSDLSFHKWMELDIYYIENWSFWLDLKILLQTVPVVLTGKGAY
ncbi:sugar transferase [Thermincola ferriacetica]